jgi:heme-degrading monooxygenase HmoA
MEGPVIVVVFEVWPAQDSKDDYLGIAATLRADLDRIDGFISIGVSKACQIRKRSYRFPFGGMRRP